jgi:hypothetical protein
VFNSDTFGAEQIDSLKSGEPTLSKALEGLPTFSTLLRKSIAEQAVRPLFTHITASRLQAWLGLSSTQEATAFVQEHLQWESDAEGFKVPQLLTTGQQEEVSPAPVHSTIGIDSEAYSLSARLWLKVAAVTELAKLLKQSTAVSVGA